MICDFQFTYDAAGNRKTILEDTGARVTWSYDSIYQLIDDNRSGTNAYRRTFTYDSVGNCLVKDVGGSLATSTFDGGDQLINVQDSTGFTTYAFDANGNQSLVVSPTGNRTTSTWGYENQIELVNLPNGNLVTSSYDADNFRVSHVI